MANNPKSARFAQKTDSLENWKKATGFVPMKGEFFLVEDYDYPQVIGDGVSSAAQLCDKPMISAISDTTIDKMMDSEAPMAPTSAEKKHLLSLQGLEKYFRLEREYIMNNCETGTNEDELNQMLQEKLKQFYNIYLRITWENNNYPLDIVYTNAIGEHIEKSILPPKEPEADTPSPILIQLTDVASDLYLHAGGGDIEVALDGNILKYRKDINNPIVIANYTTPLNLLYFNAVVDVFALYN